MNEYVFMAHGVLCVIKIFIYIGYNSKFRNMTDGIVIYDWC